MTLDAEYLRRRLAVDWQTQDLIWRYWPAARDDWNEARAGRSATQVTETGKHVVLLDGAVVPAEAILAALGAVPAAPRRLQRRPQSKRKDNRSGFTGVSRRSDGRWQARKRLDGQERYLGTFATPEEAAAAYAAA